MRPDVLFYIVGTFFLWRDFNAYNSAELLASTQALRKQNNHIILAVVNGWNGNVVGKQQKSSRFITQLFGILHSTSK